MSDEPAVEDPRTVHVAVGVIIACLVYGGSLALQTRLPAVRDLLAIDLGPGVHPTYYLRVALSLGWGTIVSALVALVGRGRPVVSEKLAAVATAALVATAAMLAMVFP